MAAGKQRKRDLDLSIPGSLRTVTAPEPNEKARQILDGARDLFLELGYEGTSVEGIARHAQVSKPTIYNHFADKRSLFIAMVRRECFDHTQQMFELGEKIGSGSIEPILRQVATRYLALLMSPLAQSIFRIAVAEAQRFPEIGHAFYDAGPATSRDRVAALLIGAVERGELAIDDVVLAADQFLDLCKARIHLQRVLFVIAPIEDEEVARFVEQAVAMFLRAYRA